MHHWKHSHVGGVQRSALRVWGHRPKRQTSNSNCLYNLGHCLYIYSKMFIFFHNVHVSFNMNKGLWITFFFSVDATKTVTLLSYGFQTPLSRDILLPETSLFSVKQSLPPASMGHFLVLVPLLGALLMLLLWYRILAEKSAVSASILTCQRLFSRQLKLHHGCLCGIYSATITLPFISFSRSPEVRGNSRNSALGQTYILYDSGLKLYSYY